MPSPGLSALAIALAFAGAAVVLTTGQGTRLGAMAGLLVAVVAILGLGPGALPPLAAFVLGSGALTRIGRERKKAAGTAEPREGRRGAAHVAAKLGIPGLLGAAALVAGSSRGLALAYSAALVGAFADTAGTEVGPLGTGSVFGLQRGRFRRLEHGSTGGISGLGLIATALGASAAAGTAVASGLIELRPAGLLAFGAGLLAALLESLIGGTSFGLSLGHFGRNAMVSLASVCFAVGALAWI